MERVKMVTVDEELCLGCGECLRECPNGPSTSGRHVDHGNVLCARCLHCYAVCPQGAIRLEDTGAARVNGNGHAVAADELEGFLAHRRSVRRFRDEPVPEEVVERIVRAAIS
jgi:ferredoxin